MKAQKLNEVNVTTFSHVKSVKLQIDLGTICIRGPRSLGCNGAAAPVSDDHSFCNYLPRDQCG